AFTRVVEAALALPLEAGFFAPFEPTGLLDRSNLFVPTGLPLLLVSLRLCPSARAQGRECHPWASLSRPKRREDTAESRRESMDRPCPVRKAEIGGHSLKSSSPLAACASVRVRI